MEGNSIFDIGKLELMFACCACGKIPLDLQVCVNCEKVVCELCKGKGSNGKAITKCPNKTCN